MENKEICWNITARCNQTCKYCHRFLYPSDLTFEHNKRILNNLIESGVDAITWTGGEALLVDNIDELLRLSFNNGIKNKLITNGKILTKETIDKIYPYLDSITLSIDSIDNDINDKLGRGYNHYEEVKNVLDYVKEKGYDVKLRINSVVCKCNLDSFKDLNEFLSNYDIYSWRIFKFMPLREIAVINKDKFDITMEEYDEVIKYIKKNSNTKNIDTRIQTDMEQKYVLILANGDIVITSDGEDNKVGNALKVSMKQFI